VSRWQHDHEGSRRNAIGKFRCGHGLCAGDGGRPGAFAGIAPSGLPAFIVAQLTGMLLALLAAPTLWPPELARRKR